MNPFQYTGREFDSETGLYYYRARYYDPTGGRFLSEDPILFSGGIDFYRYLQNNPTDLTDASGEWPTPTGPIICFTCVQFGAGAYDMWVNYRRMEQRGWVRGDKYYHCLANCWATDEGPGGAAAAKIISFIRTDIVSRVREPGDWRNDDKANKCGQQGGDCKKRCEQYIPKYSPGKPPFQW